LLLRKGEGCVMTPLVKYTVGLIGEIFWAVGDAITASAADTGNMHDLTIGIFSDEGGLIFWYNEKLLWMMEQIISGLRFSIAGY
jgi:hypothetical protein